MNNNRPKKLLLSLQRVDLDNDDALEAFAQRVWEQAIAAFGEGCNNQCEIEEDGDDRGIHHDA